MSLVMNPLISNHSHQSPFCPSNGQCLIQTSFWYFMASLGLSDVYLSGAGSPGKGAIDGQMKKGELWLTGIRQQTGTRSYSLNSPGLGILDWPSWDRKETNNVVFLSRDVIKVTRRVGQACQVFCLQL